MNSDSLYQALLGAAATKRSIFVSYHHGGDRGYYDAFSRAFADTYQIIEDNSVERQIDSDNAEYVIRKIREQYITGSSCTLVLCGAETPRRKFVDWEIKATLDKQHGLIAVCLPTNPQFAAPENVKRSTAARRRYPLPWIRPQWRYLAALVTSPAGSFNACRQIVAGSTDIHSRSPLPG